MTTAPLVLDLTQREAIERAIKEACSFRNWPLRAVNARSNHIHLVVSAAESPERVMNALKARCTRTLRALGLVDPDRQLWSRHGSTVYLWNEQQAQSACDYVVHGQDKPGE
jgi:REP element-mobilizing transposase RayT